jgi:hypothetical protein
MSQNLPVSTDNKSVICDPVYLAGNAQIPLSISASAAQTAALSEGLYDVWTTTDCCVKVATTANDVTTSTGYIIYAGAIITLVVPDQYKIGAITSSASGTFSAHKVR